MLQFKDKIGGVMEISFQKERENIREKIKEFAEKLNDELRKKIYSNLYPLIGKEITLYGSRLPTSNDYLSGRLINLDSKGILIKYENGTEIKIPYDDIEKIWL
jgi:hypothetical protein